MISLRERLIQKILILFILIAVAVSGHVSKAFSETLHTPTGTAETMDYFQVRHIQIDIRTTQEFFPDIDKDLCEHVGVYLQEKFAEAFEENFITLYGCGSENRKKSPNALIEQVLFVDLLFRHRSRQSFEQEILFDLILVKETYKRMRFQNGRPTAYADLRFEAFTLPRTDDTEGVKKDIYTLVNKRLNQIVSHVIRAHPSASLETPRSRIRRRVPGQEEAEATIRAYQDNPQKVMEIYLRHKTWRQERLNGRLDYLDLYESYLQEHGLIDPDLTREDLINDYFIGALKMHQNDPRALNAAYSLYIDSLKKRGMSVDRFEKEYRRILRSDLRRAYRIKDEEQQDTKPAPRPDTKHTNSVSVPLVKDKLITPTDTARSVLRHYSEQPDEVMRRYLAEKEFRQKTAHVWQKHLAIYETYLQEHNLIDPALTREDLQRDFVLGALEMHADNPETLLPVYIRHRNWHEQNNIDISYLEKYEAILKEKGLLE